MKYIDTQQTSIEKLPGKRLSAKDRFGFQCHPDLACFNRCCRNLNLFLYPYDMIRLKKGLNLSTDQIIDQLTEVVLRPGMYFPDVLLRMADNAEQTCPFLSDTGCGVYLDRPYSCRLFPVEQGLLYQATGETTIIQIFRPPDFCLGQHETRQWTPEAWVKDQQATVYQQMTIRWAELKRRFVTNPWGSQGPEGPTAKMTFMALYNLDEFRNFVFHSSFLKRHKIKSPVKRKLQTNDLELLKLAMEWVAWILWRVPAKRFFPK